MVFPIPARRLFRFGAVLALALAALLPTRASAELTLKLEPSSQTVLPGGTGSVELFLSNSGAPVDIATFNYQLRVADSSPFSFTGVSDATPNYIFGIDGFGIGGVLGNDGGFNTLTVSDFLNSFVPPDSPVTLATNGEVSLGLITFSIAAGSGAQSVPIEINPDINFTFVASTNTGVIIPIGIDGAFGASVLLVPEPSSFLLMLGAGVVPLTLRRKTGRPAEVVEA